MWKYDNDWRFLISREDAGSKAYLETIKSYLGVGALDRLAEIAVPKIEGHELVKKAVILTTLSLDDRGGDVNRLHTLLYGDEGTGKGKFLSWISDNFHVPKVNHRSTEAGLTGNARVMGLLSKTPVVAIDEIDKMRISDINGMLEAMSEGAIEMTQSPGHTKNPAPVRVVCACNRIEKFSRETMDRFDFQIRLKHPDIDTTKNIISKRIRGWGNIAEIPTPWFWVKTFLFLSRQPTPKLVNVEIIDGILHGVVESSQSMRKYESILRIALAWARLELRDCDETHILGAIQLLADIKKQYSNSVCTSTLKVDKV